MSLSESDALRVDVPVGFLLPEAREILVSVDRPADSPLSIRLRLIPAEDAGPSPTAFTARPTAGYARPHRRDRSDDPDQEYGGSD